MWLEQLRLITREDVPRNFVAGSFGRGGAGSFGRGRAGASWGRGFRGGWSLGSGASRYPVEDIPLQVWRWAQEEKASNARHVRRLPAPTFGRGAAARPAARGRGRPLVTRTPEETLSEHRSRHFFSSTNRCFRTARLLQVTRNGVEGPEWISIEEGAWELRDVFNIEWRRSFTSREITMMRGTASGQFFIERQEQREALGEASGDNNLPANAPAQENVGGRQNGEEERDNTSVSAEERERLEQLDREENLRRVLLKMEADREKELERAKKEEEEEKRVSWTEGNI